jgi:hypothetical protein
LGGPPDGIMDICFIWRPFNIFCYNLVHFVVIWYIFPRVGKLYQEKSGSPDMHNTAQLCREKGWLRRWAVMGLSML